MALNRTKLAAAAVLVAGGLAAGIGPVVFPLAQAQPPGGASATPPAADPLGDGGFPGAAAAAPPKSGRTSPFGAPGGAYPPGVGTAGSGGGIPGMDPGGYGMEGGGLGGAPRQSRIEYRYIGMPDSATRFVAMLNDEAAQGWEYVGQVEFGAGEWQKVKGRPNQLAGIGPRTTTVAMFKRSPRTTAARASSGMMDPMMMPGMPGAMPGAFPGGGGRGGRRPGDGDGMPGGFGGSPESAAPMGLAGGVDRSDLAGDSLFGGSEPAAVAYEVIRLKSGNADEVARVLGQVLNDRNVRVVAGPNSSSIIVVASQPDLVIVKSLLEKLLDEPPGLPARSPKR